MLWLRSSGRASCRAPPASRSGQRVSGCAAVQEGDGPAGWGGTGLHTVPREGSNQPSGSSFFALFQMCLTPVVCCCSRSTWATCCLEFSVWLSNTRSEPRPECHTLHIAAASIKQKENKMFPLLNVLLCFYGWLWLLLTFTGEAGEQLRLNRVCHYGTGGTGQVTGSQPGHPGVGQAPSAEEHHVSALTSSTHMVNTRKRDDLHLMRTSSITSATCQVLSWRTTVSSLHV